MAAKSAALGVGLKPYDGTGRPVRSELEQVAKTDGSRHRHFMSDRICLKYNSELAAMYEQSHAVKKYLIVEHFLSPIDQKKSNFWAHNCEKITPRLQPVKPVKRTDTGVPLTGRPVRTRPVHSWSPNSKRTGKNPSVPSVFPSTTVTGSSPIWGGNVATVPYSNIFDASYFTIAPLASPKCIHSTQASLAEGACNHFSFG
ncbi:hypothetical protein K438DRAFT_1762881 [Mycena galopus ATCC 62051]|nr:hypothetical protein K438DRAFT_1762881 [Mycena galopus ATCC 62051]